MTLQLKILVLLGILLVGFGSGFGTRHYIASSQKKSAEIEDLKADKEEFKSYIANLESRDATIRTLNQNLQTLEADSARSLDEALTEDDRLRNDVATAKRMRLKGTSCGPDGSGGQATAAGSQDDAADIELSPETRQLVFDLRASITEDAEQIEYLKGYIIKNNLGGAAAPDIPIPK